MFKGHIRVFLSADYEVFHGRNFTGPDEGLFQPTDRLLNICEQLDVPITLFADVCSVEAYKRAKQTDYVAKFENQLCTAITKKHDVQLHIHPHWTVATLKAGTWQLLEDKIHISEFGFEDKSTLSAPQILEWGSKYLTQLLKPYRADYECIAFRAGGLAMQPNERELIAALENCGIRIDSSLAKNLRLDLDTLKIDYSKLPSSSNWWINRTKGLQSKDKSGLYEIPIASFRLPLHLRMSFLWRRLSSISLRRGAGISRSKTQSRLAGLKRLALENFRYLGLSPHFLLSPDTKGFTASMLVRGFDQYVKQHEGSANIDVSMLSHPKLMFDPQFEIFAQFISAVKRKYGLQISFVNYLDYYRSQAFPTSELTEGSYGQ